MKWLNNLWLRIIESDNQPLLDKIKVYQDKAEALQDEIDAKNNTIKSLNAELESDYSEIQILNNEIEELNKQIVELKKPPVTIKDVDNDTYFIRKIERKKTWKPGKSIVLHESLMDFSNDQEYQSKYKAFLDEIKAPVGKKSADNIVYLTTVAVLDFVHGKYMSDKARFGASDYWLSPQEAFDFYVTDKKYADCEDVSALLWGAIVTRLLEYGYADESWRLKRVNLSIEGSGGHAINTWLKDNLVWAPIESTFAQQTFRKDWDRDCDVFKSMYANPYNIFDEEKEYALR